MEKLHVHLLGNIEIMHEDKNISELLSLKSIAIIVILACNLEKKITREKLASMLWPEGFETANYNLRYNLWNIKKAIPQNDMGEDFILANKDHCYVNPKYRFYLDLYELYDFERKKIEDIELDELYLVKDLFKGEFLEQFYIKDSEDLNDWILYERAKIQKLFLKCLNQIEKKLFENQKYDKCINILEEILINDPYNEDIYLKLMKLYIGQGERHLAIGTYKRCDNILRSELNISPENNIKDIYMSLINDDEKIVPHNDKQLILNVNKRAMEEVDYYLMSDIVEKLLAFTPKNILDRIPKHFWNDAYRIHPSAIEYADDTWAAGNIEDIRLFISIKKILERAMKEVNITINIYNSKHIDTKSKRFLDYISPNIKANFLNEE